MADISQLNLPNDSNSPYNLADTTARNALSNKMDKANPTGTGSFSLNRQADTTVGSNSVAVGKTCEASGDYSHAEGSYSIASGTNSHAECDATWARGEASHAEGQRTTASGLASHAEGYGTTASGSNSHAEGSGTTASGSNSHTEGSNTIANHGYQHVFGQFNIADTSTNASTARGDYVEIVGNGTGYSNRSNARTLDWNGNEVLAGDLTINGTTSVTTALGTVTTALGNKADKVSAPAEYDATSTYKIGDIVSYNGSIYQSNSTISTAEAWNSSHWVLRTPDADYLHSVNPTGNGSFSLNRKASTTIGICSFAEGYDATASGNYSHAEGNITTASGNNSHAEGYNCTASADTSHAEGYGTTASKSEAHAEGSFSKASGSGSHAEGSSTIASGSQSHTEGSSTTASGKFSHAEGYYTSANHRSQHVFGEYNILDPSTASATAKGNYIEIVGKGTSTSARSNARTLDWSGNEVLAGTLTQSSDEKLKDIINEELPDVSTIKAVKFTWKKGINRDDSEHIGYLAQDVEKVLPYLVKEDAEGNKVLDYIAFLVAKVNSLEKRLAELENDTTKNHNIKENNK